MNASTVRSDKNRKRKNEDSDDKENELNETRETMALLKSVIQSFDLAFPKEKVFTSWKDIKKGCEKFTNGISTYMELVSEIDRRQLIQQSLPAIVVCFFLLIIYYL